MAGHLGNGFTAIPKSPPVFWIDYRKVTAVNSQYTCGLSDQNQKAGLSLQFETQLQFHTAELSLCADVKFQSIYSKSYKFSIYSVMFF